MFGIEAVWEIAENSPIIVDRYRQSALALGYSGDSVLNSVSDSLAAALGFCLAYVLPVRLSVAVVAGIELFLGYMIHDNLTLNIIHLIRPSAAVFSSGTGSCPAARRSILTTPSFRRVSICRLS